MPLKRRRPSAIADFGIHFRLGLQFPVHDGGGSPADAWTSSVAVDPSGNTYIAFDTQGSGNLDPAMSAAGAFQNTSPTINYQGGYAKYDASGNFQWLTPLYCPGRSNAFHVAVGPKSGDVYVCGNFKTSSTFTTTGGNTITVAGTAPITSVGFVARLAAATGQVVWMNAFTTGSSSAGICQSIACDAAENVYVEGSVYANGTASLNSVYGSGDSGLPLVADNTKNNSITMLFLKCDKDGNGAWLQLLPGLPNAVELAVDASGNAYFTSYFSGTQDFDPSPAVHDLTAIGSQDAYVEKLDTNGNFVWVKQFGMPNTRKNPSDFVGRRIAVDSNNNVDFLLDGLYSDTVTLKSGKTSTTGNLWQLDTNGNPRWAVTVSEGLSGTMDGYYDFCLDSANDIYNGLVNEYSSSGTLVLSAAAGSGGSVGSRSNACDASGNFVFGGTATDPSSTMVYGQANISPTSTPVLVQTWGGPVPARC